ncbi:MAG: hypothetical protein NTX44_02340 [Ignavibacteriales bacterium]|nr:hypothetical protein [Ignavibacteriales bacterium]
MKMKSIFLIGFYCFSIPFWEISIVAQKLENTDISLSKRPWKGYSILGNGTICAVYSDDRRIDGKGIQHFYYNDYTCDYISASKVSLYNKSTDNQLIAIRDKEIGFKSFFTASTNNYYPNSTVQLVNCYAHPENAIILSSQVSGGSNELIQKIEINLVDKKVTDKEIRMVSLKVENNKAIAEWSNNVFIVIAGKTSEQLVDIKGSVVSVTGKVRPDEKLEVIICPSKSLNEAIENVNRLRSQKDLYASAQDYWSKWLKSGIVPQFNENEKSYSAFFERNIYCVKSAILNGQIPADITGQFVTNNMPQLYPRDEMMCARVMLLTGHFDEAKDIITFWNRKEIPRKSKGEWYARYDANAKAVDGGTGARYDEPEWDANGYYIQLIDMYYQQKKVWLVNKDFIYELADFLVSKIDKNSLLYEGGIVEWTGYLPATNMTCAASLLTASKIADSFGDKDKALLYKNTSEKISVNLIMMFDKKNGTYADVRYIGIKGANNESLSNITKDTLYLWDCSMNFGLIWGYPNHKEAIESNNFYQKNTYKLNGGVQYFETLDNSLTDYGHACFFFTTAASAQYHSLFGNPKVAKQNIDWMINNSNSYGLMPERIYLNNSDCSPASPLSWCSAEFSAALLYYSKVSK